MFLASQIKSPIITETLFSSYNPLLKNCQQLPIIYRIGRYLPTLNVGNVVSAESPFLNLYPTIPMLQLSTLGKLDYDCPHMLYCFHCTFASARKVFPLGLFETYRSF